MAAIVSNMGPSFLNGMLFRMSFFMICSLIYMKSLTKICKLNNLVYICNELPFLFLLLYWLAGPF